MPVDAGWAQRNLGLSLAEFAGTGAVEGESGADGSQLLRRELIDFDSQGPSGAAFQAQATEAAIGLSHFVPLTWPQRLAPRAGRSPTGESLPKADVLIVTWTVDEGHGLSQVLTPGVDSHSGWKDYTKNFKQISETMSPTCPARQAGRLGTYWTTQIGNRSVTLFKSDSHMSQDGPDLANAVVWKQIIEDCEPSWVITTGTGGGIGSGLEVGDVIVSRFVTFDCQRGVQEFQRRIICLPVVSPVGQVRGGGGALRHERADAPKGQFEAPEDRLSDLC